MVERIQFQIQGTANFAPVYAQIDKLKTSLTGLSKINIGTGFNQQTLAGLKNAETSFLKTVSSVQGLDVETVKLSTATDHLTYRLSRAKLTTEEYFNIWKNRSQQTLPLLGQIAAAQAKIAESAVIPSSTREGMAHVITNMQGMASSSRMAAIQQQLYNTAMRDASTHLINFGKNTQWAGRQLMVGFTVPMAAAGAALATMFYQVDKNMQMLQRTYGIGGAAGQAFTKALPSQAELDNIKGQIQGVAQQMANMYGQSAQETTAVAAGLSAAGYTQEQLVNLTKTVSQAMVLGETDQQSAMKATISLQTAYKLSTSQTADAMNFFSAAQAATSTTMKDLIDAIPRVGPIVRNLGGTYKDTVAFLVAMKEGGVGAADGANALKNSLQRLIVPTKAAVQQLMSYGIDLPKIVKDNTGNVVGMVESLQAALDKLPALARQQAITELFGKFQAARVTALLDNFNRTGTQSAKVMQMMSLSSKDLGDIAAQQTNVLQQSSSGKFKIAVESLKTSLLPIAQAFLDVATKIINGATGIVNAFQKLGPLRYIIGGIFTGGAILGPIIMMTGLFANLIGQVFKLTNLLRMFRQGFSEGGGFGSPLKSILSGLQNLSNYFVEIDKAQLASERLSNSVTGQMQSQKEILDLYTAALTRYVQEVDRVIEIQQKGGPTPPAGFIGPGPTGGSPTGGGGTPLISPSSPTSAERILAGGNVPRTLLMQMDTVNGLQVQNSKGQMVGPEISHLIPSAATQEILGSRAVFPGRWVVPGSPGSIINQVNQNNPLPLIPPQMMTTTNIMSVLRQMGITPPAGQVAEYGSELSAVGTVKVSGEELAMLRALGQIEKTNPNIINQYKELKATATSPEDVHAWFGQQLGGAENWTAMREQAMKDVRVIYDKTFKQVEKELIASGQGPITTDISQLRAVAGKFGENVSREFLTAYESISDAMQLQLSAISTQVEGGLSKQINSSAANKLGPSLIAYATSALSGLDIVTKVYQEYTTTMTQSLTNMAERFTAETAKVAAMGELGAGITGVAAVKSFAVVPKFATGGAIRGPGGTRSDHVPAMLSHGEYVINANAAQQVGTGFLDAINKQKLAFGGPSSLRMSGMLENLFGPQMAQSSSEIEKYLTSPQSVYTGHNISDFFASRKAANNVDLAHIQEMISNYKSSNTPEEQQLIKALQEHASGDWGNKGPLAGLDPKIVDAGRALLSEKLTQIPGDTVRLYRAIANTPETGKVAPGHYGYLSDARSIEQLQPYMSYSSDIERAMIFAQNNQIANARIVEVDVPKSAIVGIQNANYTGKPGEGEFIVKSSEVPGGARYVTFTGFSTKRKISDDPLLKFLGRPGAESKDMLLQDISNRYRQLRPPEASQRVPGYWENLQSFQALPAGQKASTPLYSPDKVQEFFGVTPEEVQIARQHLEEKYGMSVQELAKRKNNKLTNKNIEDYSLMRMVSNNNFVTSSAPGAGSILWSPEYINRASGGPTGRSHHHRFYKYHSRKYKYASGGPTGRSHHHRFYKYHSRKYKYAGGGDVPTSFQGSPASMDTYMRFMSGKQMPSKDLPIDEGIIEFDDKLNSVDNLIKYGHLPQNLAEVIANSAVTRINDYNDRRKEAGAATKNALFNNDKNLTEETFKEKYKNKKYSWKNKIDNYLKEIDQYESVHNTRLLENPETEIVKNYIRQLFEPGNIPEEVSARYLEPERLDAFIVRDLFGLQHGHLQGNIGEKIKMKVQGAWVTQRTAANSKTPLGIGTIASTAAENQIFGMLSRSASKDDAGSKQIKSVYEKINNKNKKAVDQVIAQNGQVQTYGQGQSSYYVFDQMSKNSELSARNAVMLKQAAKSLRERTGIGSRLSSVARIGNFGKDMANRAVASMVSQGTVDEGRTNIPRLIDTLSSVFTSTKPAGNAARMFFQSGFLAPKALQTEQTNQFITGLGTPLSFLRGNKGVKGFSTSLASFMDYVDLAKSRMLLSKGGPIKLADGGMFKFPFGGAVPSRMVAPGHQISMDLPSEVLTGLDRTGGISNMFNPNVKLPSRIQDFGVSQQRRADVEQSVFGIPTTAPWTERPVYGYLRRDGEYMGAAYGNVTIDIEPRRGQKVTTTVDDSFKINPSLTPAEILSPAHTQPEQAKMPGIAPEGGYQPAYREVQIHGGSVPLSQIKAATYHFDSGFANSQGTKIEDQAREALRFLDWAESQGIRANVEFTRGFNHDTGIMDRNFLGRDELQKYAEHGWSAAPVAKNEIKPVERKPVPENVVLANGGVAKLADGGIPAMVSNGEYFFGPDTVKHYGKGFMDNLNAGKFAEGGKIVGPGGPKDDVIPMMLPEHSYIINAAATQKAGTPLLDAINSKKFSTGGILKLSEGTGKPSSWPSAAIGPYVKTSMSGMNDPIETKPFVADSSLDREKVQQDSKIKMWRNKAFQKELESLKTQFEAAKDKEEKANTELGLAKANGKAVEANYQQQLEYNNTLKQRLLNASNSEKQQIESQIKISEANAADAKAELAAAEERIIAAEKVAKFSQQQVQIAEEQVQMQMKIGGMGPMQRLGMKAGKFMGAGGGMGVMMGSQVLSGIGSTMSSNIAEQAGGQTALSGALGAGSTGLSIGSMFMMSGTPMGIAAGLGITAVSAIYGAIKGAQEEEQRNFQASLDKTRSYTQGFVSQFETSATALGAFGLSVKKFSDLKLGKSATETSALATAVDQLVQAIGSAGSESDKKLVDYIKGATPQAQQAALLNQFRSLIAAGGNLQKGLVTLAAYGRLAGVSTYVINKSMAVAKSEYAAYGKGGTEAVQAMLSLIKPQRGASNKAPNVSDFATPGVVTPSRTYLMAPNAVNKDGNVVNTSGEQIGVIPSNAQGTAFSQKQHEVYIPPGTVVPPDGNINVPSAYQTGEAQRPGSTSGLSSELLKQIMENYSQIPAGFKLTDLIGTVTPSDYAKMTGGDMLHSSNAKVAAAAAAAGVTQDMVSSDAIKKMNDFIDKINNVNTETAQKQLNDFQNSMDTFMSQNVQPIMDAITRFNPTQFKEFLGGLVQGNAAGWFSGAANSYGPRSDTFSSLTDTGQTAIQQILNSLQDLDPAFKDLWNKLKDGPGSVSQFLDALNVARTLNLSANQVGAITNDPSGMLLKNAQDQAAFQTAEGQFQSSMESGKVIDYAAANKGIQAVADKETKDFKKSQQALQDNIKAKGKYIDSINKEIQARQKLWDKKQQQIQQDQTLASLEADVIKARNSGDLLGAALAQSKYNAELQNQQDLKAKQAKDDADQAKIDKAQTQIQKWQDQMDKNQRTYDANQQKYQNDIAANNAAAAAATALAAKHALQIQNAEMTIDGILKKMKPGTKTTLDDLVKKSGPNGELTKAINTLATDTNSTFAGVQSKLQDTFNAAKQWINDGGLQFNADGTMNQLSVPDGTIIADEKGLHWQKGTGKPSILNLGSGYVSVSNSGAAPSENAGGGGISPPSSASSTPTHNYLAEGGYISGPGTATSDSIPAMLSNGEFVVAADAVKSVGRGTLDAINSKKFAKGGIVGGRNEAAQIPQGGWTPIQSSAIAGNTQGQKIANYAKQFAGHVPYIDSATLPGGQDSANPRNGWDCSTFVTYVYKQFGMNDVAPYTWSQINDPKFKLIPRGKELPGDTLYYMRGRGPDGKGIHHTRIYLGKGSAVGAESPGVGTAITDAFSGGWSAAHYGVRTTKDGSRRRWNDMLVGGGTTPDTNPPRGSLSYNEIELVKLLQKAGFSGQGLRMAWSIAMRESGGRPGARSPIKGTYPNGTYDAGLFQLNSSNYKGWKLDVNKLYEGLYQAQFVRSLTNNMTRNTTPWGLNPDGTTNASDYGKWSSKMILNNITLPFQKWYGEFPSVFKAAGNTRVGSSGFFDYSSSNPFSTSSGSFSSASPATTSDFFKNPSAFPGLSIPLGFTVPFASGGLVSGEGGPRDDKIHAMISNGEYVVQADAVKSVGVGFMNALNAGKFQTGGLVGIPNNVSVGPHSMPSVSQATVSPNAVTSASNSNVSNNIEYNVNVNVAGTNASPNDIADVVIRTLRQREKANTISRRITS
jgi:TP901 family phage tail tape measure protein